MLQVPSPGNFEEVYETAGFLNSTCLTMITCLITVIDRDYKRIDSIGYAFLIAYVPIIYFQKIYTIIWIGGIISLNIP